MLTHEKTNTTHKEFTREREYEPLESRIDTLRDELFLASEKGDAAIPPDTLITVVGIDSCDANLFSELSTHVNEIRNGETTEARPMSHPYEDQRSLDQFQAARRDLLKNDKTIRDLTILYDPKASVNQEGEALPSMVIANRKLSLEEIKKLRAQLSEGVPLMDGETKELLDEVGRKQQQETIRDRFFTAKLGSTAMGREKSFDSSHFGDGDMDEVWQDFYRTAFFATGDETSTNSHSSSENTSAYKVPENYVRADAIPESMEVKAHEMILKETGGRSWMDIPADEQRSVRARVMKQAHPDVGGGDAELFRAAQAVMPMEARVSTPSTKEET